VRTERAKYAPHKRKRLEDLADHEPIFLTEKGTSYTRSAFYYHWERLFEPAQRQFKKQERVEFSPHDIRHLRVSRAITKIKSDAQGDKRVEEELADGFWRLMGWRSRDTMDIYTHVFNKRKALLEVMLDDTDEPLLQEVQPTHSFPDVDDEFQAGETPGKAPTPSSQNDDFGWYEQ